MKGINLSSIIDESHGQISPKLATAAICQSYLLASFIAYVPVDSSYSYSSQVFIKQSLVSPALTKELTYIP